MMKYEPTRYDVYKDSGIEWLGDMPEHWEVMRIKEISEINKKTLSENTSPSYEFNYVDIGSVTYGVKGFAMERMTFDIAPSRAKRVVKKGDTIISTVRTYLRAIASIDEDYSDLVVSTGFAVISPNKRIFNKFCSYLLTSNLIINEICALSKGVSYPATTSSVIGDLFFLVPNYRIQKLIADYLDTKTGQIDRKIDLLTQKATKYGQLKQSLINETVTRGLDKTVVLKDSGVEWIGEVPTHWEIKRVKDIFIESKNKAGCKSSSYKVLSLTLKGVIVRDLENNKGKIPASFDGYQITQKNNIVFCLFDMDVTPRIVGYVEEEGIITSAYTVVKNRTNISMKYYYYYFLEQNRNKSLLSNSKTLRSTLTFDAFSLLRLPNAPYEEQKAISDYLDTKTAQIDKIIALINTQIDKLKELRKTLINDIVTGKIKVCKEGETI